MQGRLTHLLATGVARLLVKLALPGGALVQVLQSGYDAYETLVARARELAQVGRTLFALAGRLAQGAVAPAAQALEAVLARLLPVALDFLARTFGLDKLPKLLRLGLEALRRPIDKGLDWVLGHIVQLAKNAGKGVKKGGAAAAQAGQQAVGAVKGFFGVRTKVDGGPDEQHHLSFIQQDGKTTLIIESTPTDIRRFLVAYVKEHDIRPSSPRYAEVEGVRNLLRTYQPLYDQLEAMGADNSKAFPIHRALLAKNIELSSLLKILFLNARPSNKSGLAKKLERYRLEGLTGNYGNRPEIIGDELTYDHQPQKGVLKAAARITVNDGSLLFAPNSALALRAAGNQTPAGYAINLSVPRHEAGRTFKKNEPITLFMQAAEPIAIGTGSKQQKRQQIVGLLRQELQADAQQMEAVANDLNHATAWSDIDKLIASGQLTDKQGNDLKRQIAARILQGERELRTQPMNLA